MTRMRSSPPHEVWSVGGATPLRGPRAHLADLLAGAAALRAGGVVIVGRPVAAVGAAHANPPQMAVRVAGVGAGAAPDRDTVVQASLERIGPGDVRGG